jgi:hypothetical protein
MEASAATGIGTVDAVRSSVNAVSSVYASMTRTETRIECSTETLVEYVTKEVWGWVTSVLTVAEQLKACHDRCWETTSGLKFLACEAGCIATAFVSIVINTWTLIKTVVEQVVKTVTTCVEVIVKVPVELAPKVPPRSGSIPTSIGPGYPTEIIGSSGIIPQLDPGSLKASDIQEAFGPLVPALQCLGGGRWGTWDLAIRPVAGIDSVPIGLRLCIDKSCLEKIRSAVSWDTVRNAASVLGALIAAASAEEAAAAIITSLVPGIEPILSVVAAALGVTLAEALAALIVVLILILYNMTAIWAQIMFRELFDPKAFANGLCLVHPLIALGALAVITAPTVVGPIMAAQIAANIPLIVEAR